MDDTQLMAEISNFVAAYFKRHENQVLLYYNYNHTLKVVERVAEIRASHGFTILDD